MNGVPRPARVDARRAGFTVMAMALGFFLAVQAQTERTIESRLQVTSGRLGEVAYRYRQEDQRQERERREIEDLRLEMAEREQQAVGGRRALASLEESLARARMLAGLTPLRGPGVIVTVADSSRPLQRGEDPNLVLIHYSDVHAVVQTLWAAGAEAIAVNDERLVDRTGISCVGTTILCNTRRLAPPYRVTAIGNPDILQGIVLARGGILDELRTFDFPVTVTTGADLRVPAYAGGFEYHYARPVGKGG
jgi:uncharacterized protein YlxW (UPF0749 family)